MRSGTLGFRQQSGRGTAEAFPADECLLVAHDEHRRTLTYEAENSPRFLKTARNRWHVRVFDATVEPRDITGWLLYLALRVKLARAVQQFVRL